MQRATFFIAATLLFCSAHVSFSFDIAIYNDPLSHINGGVLWCSRWQNTPAWCDSAVIHDYYNDSQMDSVYRLYEEMGVTHIMVNYIKPDNFDWIRNDSTHIKVMNWNYPGHVGMRGDKYVDAQYRDVAVGLLPEQGAFWSFLESIGSSATRDVTGPSFFNEIDWRPVVFMSGSSGTLWQPTSELGRFSGWDWRQTGWIDSTIYMPMHFKLTWAVDPDGPINTSTPIADFYWIVQAPSDTNYNPPRDRWWRFPAKTLTLDTLADTTNWITSEFVDSAKAGMYDLLDENLTVLDNISMDGIHTGPASPPRSLDEIYLSGVSYGQFTSVRMQVEYRGTHAFYLNRIEVYDEGAYRMFASPDSSRWADSIWYAFRDEYNNSGGKSAGWYYDEWDMSGDHNGNPVVRSINKVQKILHDHNLPPFWLNGHTFWPGGPQNKQLRDLEAAGIYLPVKMHEFYPISSATWCMPHDAWGSSPAWLEVDTESDPSYGYIDAEHCGTLVSGNCTLVRLIGRKSLQCAIDGRIWDEHPMEVMTETVPSGCAAYIPGLGGLLSETKWVHDSTHSKMWALIGGSGELSDNSSSGNCCPMRNPTPNEIKLTAWLAVACDVDGIMWYPWNFGGLFEGGGWPYAFHPDTAGRYEAARKVGQDIKAIAPILESLEFVKTYASRAYETDYPNSTYAATQLDTLATNCTWYE